MATHRNMLLSDAEVRLGPLLIVAGSAALGGLLFGFDIAIITGAGPFLAIRFDLDDLRLGFAFSALLFGCVFGSFFAGRAADRWGARHCLITVAGLFALSSVGAAIAPSFTTFVFARFVGGLAVGAASLVSPMYIAEVSPPSIRGRMGALYQMSIIIGILISYCVNYLLRHAGTENWRWMFLTGLAPSLFFLVMIFRSPETPRFLVRQARHLEARRLLKHLGGEQNVASEMAAIEGALSCANMEGSQINGQPLNPVVRRALMVSFGLAVLVQLSGINTIVDYAPVVFRSAGARIDEALSATLLVGLTECIATLISFWTIDRWGRRPLYIVGSVGMAIALIALCAAVLTHHFAGLLALTLILIYLAFFASSIGPVFWTWVPELLPTETRGRTMMVPVMTQWVANALVVLVFPWVFDHWGKAVTFGFLAIMCLMQAGLAWRYVPETRNRTLEMITSYWKSTADAKT